MADDECTELATQLDVRDVNEWISDTISRVPYRGSATNYRCECGDRWCSNVLELTEAEYASVRCESTRFMVATNHESPDERVVDEQQRFAVVTTIHGWASRAASDADPRSN